MSQYVYNPHYGFRVIEEIAINPSPNPEPSPEKKLAMRYVGVISQVLDIYSDDVAALHEKIVNDQLTKEDLEHLNDIYNVLYGPLKDHIKL